MTQHWKDKHGAKPVNVSGIIKFAEPRPDTEYIHLSAGGKEDVLVRVMHKKYTTVRQEEKFTTSVKCCAKWWAAITMETASKEAFQEQLSTWARPSFAYQGATFDLGVAETFTISYRSE